MRRRTPQAHRPVRHVPGWQDDDEAIDAGQLASRRAVEMIERVAARRRPAALSRERGCSPQTVPTGQHRGSQSAHDGDASNSPH
jgi:hypothetical protein